MRNSFIISRVLLGTALCLALAVPAMAEGTPAKKSSPAPKTSTSAPAKSSGKKATARSDSPEQLQAKLDSFAQTTIGSINRCVLPSATKKEVTKNSDGTFTARYLEMDPKSISTSYKPSEGSTVVPYIGYMRYDEVEYACTAASQSDALKGPFTATRRAPTTELIKYTKGKWTY